MKKEQRELILRLWDNNTKHHGLVSIDVGDLSHDDKCLISSMPFEGKINKPIRLKYFQRRMDQVWNLYIDRGR